MAETIVRKELREAFLDQGIQDINFFNGRLLTAGDLVTLQDASRKRDHQLGQAIGEGIVSGLEVRLVADGSDGKAPVVAIAKGLAVNRLGQVVSLAQDVEVQLAKEKPERSTNGGLFEYCLPPQQNGKPIPGKGAYLLVARPAIHYKGLAPRRGFGKEAKVEGCDRDLLQEGTQFRLVSMDVTTLEKLESDTLQELVELLRDTNISGFTGLAAQHKLRNWLAHICFGTEELRGWLRDPLARVADSFFGAAVRSPFHTYGAVDALRSQGLLDECDVPLALVCWVTTGVKWVDMWSVRRRLARLPLSQSWPLPLSERRQAEGEAIFLQFQDQVESLFRSNMGNATMTTIQARQFFRFLPATGLVPLAGLAGQRGFNLLNYTQGITTSDLVHMEGARLESLLRLAISYPPYDPRSGEMIWTYLVRENRRAIDDRAGSPPQACLVFTSGSIPYQGVPRFDGSWWNYSNYV
jgi:hypothetical protein